MSDIEPEGPAAGQGDGPGVPAGPGDPGPGGYYTEDHPSGDAAAGASNKSRTPAIIAVAAAALLIVAAIATIPHFVSGGSKAPSSQQLATASVQSFPVTVSAPGTVVPASEVAVNFTTSGQLSEVDVQVGQKVTAGTVLARLDSSQPQTDVAKAQAAVSAADVTLAADQAPLDAGKAAQLQAALSSAQAVYSQTVGSVGATASEDAAVVAADKQQLAGDEQRLTTDGCSNWQPTNALICQSDQSAVSADQGRVNVDASRAAGDATDGQLRETQAESAVSAAQAAMTAASTPDAASVAAAQAAVSSAQAQLQSAEDEIAALTLTAPSAGTILQINGQIGETVSGSPTGAPTLPGTSAPIPAVTNSSGATLNPTSTPLIVIGATSSFVVGAAFPASDVGQLSAGEQGTITADTLSGLSIPCHVLAVASDTTVVDGAPVVYASVIPDTSMDKLSPGLAVTVNVGVTQAVAVLAVPQSAVFLVSGLPHVDVWNGGHAVPTAVTTGSQGTQLVQITSGLEQGEQVVLSAYPSLPASGSSSGGT